MAQIRQAGNTTMIKTKTKTLGVIGGLGPMATAYYMELVIQMTDASCDQEHLNMIISSRPGTPDRTRYILGLSDENPAPVMIDAGRWLVAEGAEILAIPCITAHYFQKQLGLRCPQSRNYGDGRYDSERTLPGRTAAAWHGGGTPVSGGAEEGHAPDIR